MVWPRDREDPELPERLTEQFKRDLNSLNEMALWLQERNRVTVKITTESANLRGSGYRLSGCNACAADRGYRRSDDT